MANYWGRAGAPMIQPTKDELRHWLANTRTELKEERNQRQLAEYKLDIAKRKLGEMVLDSAIREDIALPEAPRMKLLRRV